MILHNVVMSLSHVLHSRRVHHARRAHGLYRLQTGKPLEASYVDSRLHYKVKRINAPSVLRDSL